MRHCFNDNPEQEVRTILGGNAAELYGFNLEKLGPIVERIGPRPEEIAAQLSEDEFPKKTHTNAFRR